MEQLSMDNLHDILCAFSQQFISAKKAPLRKHKLVTTFKTTVPYIEASIKRPDIKVKASPGQGNWADVPWIACFNSESTDSAEEGIYVVYLFSVDMSSMYLCLAQGVTSVRNEFKKETSNELNRRASLIRSRVPSFNTSFTSGPISLGGTTRLAKDYDSAVIWFRKYDLSKLPSNDVLIQDLQESISLYDLVLARGGTDNIETAMRVSLSSITENIEEERRKVRHTKLERNPKTSEKVKHIQGYTCKGCNFNFEKIYGDRGKGFIEAHHLIPISSLKEGQIVSMNLEKDFVVLCSNCHSMVHRGKALLTLEELISLPGVQELRKINR